MADLSQMIDQIHQILEKIPDETLEMEIVTKSNDNQGVMNHHCNIHIERYHEKKGEFQVIVQGSSSITCLTIEEAEDQAHLDLLSNLKIGFPEAFQAISNQAEAEPKEEAEVGEIGVAEAEAESVEVEAVEETQNQAETEQNQHLLSYQKALADYHKVTRNIYATSYDMAEAYQKLKKVHGQLSTEEKAKNRLPQDNLKVPGFF